LPTTCAAGSTAARWPRGAAAGMVELKRRATGERVELSVEDAIARIKAGA
jgi:hypothetical protein